LYFNIKKIQNLSQPKAYLYQLLSAYGFTQWNDIYDLLSAQSGKYVVANNWRLLKDRDVLILSEITKKIDTPLGILFFDEADALFGKRTTVAYIDKSKLSYPLTLRKWKEGDYFQPFGMKGSKKLSKYFKDEKLSLLEKENIWLLCSNNTIVWILGRRQDQRFIATESTSHILKVELR